MYDLIVIGAGPAGLTAGLYAARGRLDALLLERLAPGGQVLTTDWVENYPGFPEGISGFELMEKMKAQAEHFGLPIRMEEVIELELRPEKKVVITRKERLEAKALVLTLGATPKKLGIEGEDLLIGKGVSYCATCDGPFYRDQEVAVIGGGDTALEDRATAEEKIEFIWDTVPVRILGESGVEGIELKNVKTGEISRKEVQGVFVFVGTQPNSDLINGMVKQDESGFVITDEKMETSIPGVFAAGDIRSKALRQVSTAVGDAANAAFFAERFIENIE
jgi:thioredoxin reductase (NADPH)